ncbi:MAG: flagellar motor switch protein FliM [Rhodospirillaceae bacterium]|nr:flagellar motor switch protein FliM [Rhodospirillales bacterium]
MVMDEDGGESRSNDDEEALMKEWAAMAGGDTPGDGGAAPAGEESDAMAAEWEAMLGAGDGDGDGGGGEAAGEAPNSTRVLNQDEIDSLLGFDDDHGHGDDKSGIQAILNSALVSYERLPMLEVVFDRLVRMMSTSMRNFTSDNVEVSLDNILSLRFGDYLNSIPLPAMLAVFKAEEWDNYGLLTVDSSLIYSIVDVLLGGRRGTAAMRIEGRPYTTIERNLVERMVHVVLSDLSAAFDPLSPVTFRFDRLETNPRFATISRPSNAAIVAKLRIDMEDRGGRLELLLPYATLEPVRELLLQMFMGEKFGRDSIWETHLAEELWLTDVQMEAVLDEQVMDLRDVLRWRVGTKIMLNASPNSSVDLRCGDVNMFRGRMGRKGQHIAIRVDDKLKG